MRLNGDRRVLETYGSSQRSMTGATKETILGEGKGMRRNSRKAVLKVLFQHDAEVSKG